MKIAFLEIEDWEIEFIKKQLSGHTVSFYSEHIDAVLVKEMRDIEIISVFIYSVLSKDILESMPNLKLIVTRSTGFDHIDMDYCKKKGITICNIPTYGVNTVAEHTFALILAISRNIVKSVEKTRLGSFEVEGLRGFDLHGKILGIIGVGHIGTEVVRIAHGFGMRVIAYTGHPNEEIAKKLKITFHSLNELLSLSDVISLHLPLTKKTRHIINKRNIGKIKKGSMLINTARGGLIETEAILYGLEKGIFRAVGLDVLEEECAVKEEREILSKKFLEKCDLKTQLYDHILLRNENVLVTPHNAFNSNEALDTILHITTENIINFINRKPINMVNI